MHQGNNIKEYLEKTNGKTEPSTATNQKRERHNKLFISKVSQNASPIGFRPKDSIFESIISRCFW